MHRLMQGSAAEHSRMLVVSMLENRFDYFTYVLTALKSELAAESMTCVDFLRQYKQLIEDAAEKIEKGNGAVAESSSINLPTIGHDGELNYHCSNCDKSFERRDYCTTKGVCHRCNQSELTNDDSTPRERAPNQTGTRSYFPMHTSSAYGPRNSNREARSASRYSEPTGNRISDRQNHKSNRPPSKRIRSGPQLIFLCRMCETNISPKTHREKNGMCGKCDKRRRLEDRILGVAPRPEDSRDYRPPVKQKRSMPPKQSLSAAGDVRHQTPVQVNDTVNIQTPESVHRPLCPIVTPKTHSDSRELKREPPSQIDFC